MVLVIVSLTFPRQVLADMDLTSPVTTDEKPAAGKRVRQTAPEYRGTRVHHVLYLPTDWNPGKKYPVFVEYAGNRWLASIPARFFGALGGPLGLWCRDGCLAGTVLRALRSQIDATSRFR